MAKRTPKNPISPRVWMPAADVPPVAEYDREQASAELCFALGVLDLLRGTFETHSAALTTAFGGTPHSATNALCGAMQNIEAAKAIIDGEVSP